MTDIPVVAFRVERTNNDIVVEKNKSSLHIEFITDRIALIPLSIDPDTYYKKEYLFKLDVKMDKSLPITPVTSENLSIYKILEDIKGRDIDIKELSNYNLLYDYDKKKILEPFKYAYNSKEYEDYCVITELKSGNLHGSLYEEEEISLYGTPSISTGKENAAWSCVSLCSNIFKIDEDRFNEALEKQKLINNVKTNIKDFEEEFRINESERYYYLDSMFRPYYYTFEIEKVGFYSAKQVFIKGCERLVKRLTDFKNEFDLLNTEACRINLFNSDTINGGYSIIVEGETDTLGNIVQSHIVNHYIENEREDSPIMFCGYKRLHPLEEKIMFTIKMKTSDLKIIPVLFKNATQEIIDIVMTIVKEAELSFK